MSKLAEKDNFFDFSDYGRRPAVFIAQALKNTAFTPIQVTVTFGLVGLVAVGCILKSYFIVAGILLILKSIIDAVDGELARIKKIPSYSGRYLDSIFDIILNILIFFAIGYVCEADYLFIILAIVSLQLQGTLYNYYYVILRNQSLGADSTSRVFEYKIPTALPGENQKIVNFLFVVYTIFYGIFDRIIYFLDRNANKGKRFTKYFMTILSIYGLGFQLLIIAIMLNVGWIEFILPFFCWFTVFVFVMIFIRKIFFSELLLEKDNFNRIDKLD